MNIVEQHDIRATLWPRRLVEIRRKLNRSSRTIVVLGLAALIGNAFWVWHDRHHFTTTFNPLELNAWFHPAYVNSLVIAIIILYAMRQISRTREKLAPLGYPLLELEEQYRGLEIWKSVEPLTKRPVSLHVIHRGKYPTDQESWKTISHRWVRRSDKARRLTSPHIARVLDCGYAQHDSFYTVMELPRGMSLFELVEQFGACPLNRAVFLLAQTAHAIQDAHASNLFNLSLRAQHIWVGSRSSNVDWVTVVMFGYESNEQNETLARKDLRQFALIATGVMTGKWLTDEASPETTFAVSRQLDECRIPFSIKQLLMRCLTASDDEVIPPVDEIVRRMWEAVPGDPWTNDQAAAWWKEHQQDAGITR
jgi:eukaryotic-like serine/threonine-protein kinase